MNHQLSTRIRKGVKSILAVLMIVTLAIATTSPLHASQAGARRNADRLFDVLRDKGWNVRDTFTLGFLGRGESTIIRTTLQSGNTYKICAAGCEDAYDVDVFVYDENGNLIASDDDTSPLAVATVVPKWTGTFYIKVRMYDSTPAGAHFIVQYAFQ